MTPHPALVEGTRPHLFSLVPEELVAYLRSHGVRLTDAEGRRLLAHRLGPDGPRDEARRPLPSHLVRATHELLDQRRPEILERVKDPSDGFVRYLFRLSDGKLSEAVRIPLHKEASFSVCLSSQVGCAMGCAFCATGRLGFTRNLAAWEMVGMFLAIRDETPGRITGAVFQGQGEPFLNYDEVIRAAKVLSHPCGCKVAARAITISTVGFPALIRKYAHERHAYRLIVSLVSAVPHKRAWLLPKAGQVPLEELAAAIREYARVTPGRVTVALVVISGVNTGDDEVAALRDLLGDVPLRLNLIDVNDPRPEGFRRADDEERRAFLDRLQVLRVPVVRRYSGGVQAHAACGMLASRFTPQAA